MTLSIFVLIVILRVVTLSVDMLSVTVLSFVELNATMLDVVVPSVEAKYHKRKFYNIWPRSKRTMTVLNNNNDNLY